MFHILPSWRIVSKAEVGETNFLPWAILCGAISAITLSAYYRLFGCCGLRVCVGLLGLCLAHWWLTIVYSCRVEDLTMGVYMELWRISIRRKGLVGCSVGSQQRCCGMHPSLASTWCSTHRPKSSHLRVRLNVGGKCFSSHILPCTWLPACSTYYSLPQ